MAKLKDFNVTPYRMRSTAVKTKRRLNITDAEVFKTKTGKFSLRKRR